MPPRQRTVEKDGILRDPQTNIVIARRHAHPYIDVFNAIPSEAGVNFDMPAELKQLCAIHIFDNLGCSPPTEPRYIYVPPSSAIAVGGQKNVGTWEPPVKGRKAAKEADPERPVVVPDPQGWTKRKIAAMRAALKSEEIRQQLIDGADAGVRQQMKDAEGLE
ncbi:hypothetical protein CH302_19265 [Rhodococcus sp. 15-2388-1-1a]|uniref:hypothetical protein n=1 Tax=Nocardiaceae TaxID=85025 RepID=UPI00055CB0B8|nr:MULTISPECIES: hypothetical protein [Rhodococcus]OZE95081.1 hypothetical protein CH302_19265 [Rhodococcus sp. 15-2388-1-1a]